MSNNTILVTGGAGYIGSHVCKALAQAGYVPVAYDNLSCGSLDAVQWGPFVQGDIRDRKALASAILQYRPVAIMHFAALIRVGDSVCDPAMFYENNVYGTLCLLEEARKAGIGKMVFSSTAAVYGVPQVDFLDEAMPLAPINPYGQTKLAAENMIRDFGRAYGLNYAILRYFNAAGADPEADIGTNYKKDTHLIPLLMQVAAGHMASINVYGTDYPTTDGTAVRDYVHVSDLARAHVMALEKIMDDGQNLTLNLGTNAGHSVNEVIAFTRSITGHAIPAVLAPRRAGDPPVLVANSAEAERLLGWRAQHSDLETIIATAWKWRQLRSGLVKPSMEPGNILSMTEGKFQKQAA
jgi:UDP-arabinose 4-epimerase